MPGIRVAASLLLCAVVTTACGARLTPDEIAAGRDHQISMSSGSSPASGSAGRSVTGPGFASGVDTAGSPDQPTVVTSDDGVTGPAPVATPTGDTPTPDDDVVITDRTASPCAADNGGATDIGVTDTEIVIGNVSWLTGAISGFAKTGVAGAQAYLSYQNSLGGVCGRRLVLHVADDRFDAGANRSEYARLAKSVFAFAGSLSPVDNGGVSALRGTNISDTSLALSDEKIALPNSYSTMPLDVTKNSSGIVSHARWAMANRGITNFAVIWPANATARNRANGYIADFESVGLRSAYESEVAVTETNYTPAASAICDEDHEHMFLITGLEVNGMSRLAKSLKQQGCLPKMAVFGAQAYGDRLAELAGAAAEGIDTILSFDIPEGSDNPMVQAFAEWYARVSPGSDRDYFAAQGWLSARMLVEAMLATGRDLTRDNVRTQLDQMTSFTAAGMAAAINPAKRIGASCFIVAEIRSGRWVKVAPTGAGFICP